MEKLNLDKVAKGVIGLPKQPLRKTEEIWAEPAASPPDAPEELSAEDKRLAAYLELVHFGKRERRCGNCLAYLGGICPGWGYADADAVRACMAGAAALASRQALKRGLTGIDTDVIDILLERVAGDISKNDTNNF